MPWYEHYFTADYWAYADDEYSPERTGAEVDYLATVLNRYAPGGRVLDLACGVGRHAIALARRGFDVTGVDMSAYALDRAERAAADAGVRLGLHRADLLRSADWGVAEVDAVICVQAFGWGSDADQLRLLRQVRQVLVPGGVFVLDHSNILAIMRIYQPEGLAEIGGATFHFLRRYDPVTGRSTGEVRIRRADGTSVVLPDDIRMYQPAEVRSLLTRAGFTVEAADADFTIGAPVAMSTRYVQFVARPQAVLTSALAGHRQPVPAEGLDLRWAPDEAEFVEASIAQAWATVAESGPALADRARRYDLADPYGGGRVTPVLAANLRWPAGAASSDATLAGATPADAAPSDAAPAGVTPAGDRISVGAGVTGLLHDLARLADGGTVLIDPIGHPHLAVTARQAGDEVQITGLADVATALAAVERFRPAVTVLDRPGLTGAQWSPDDVRVLAAATIEAGGVLVVDETCGAYAPPDRSVAPLTDRVAGLIVLRSMSKGYCCGGLRIGFAIASPDQAGAVRAVLAPLAASALALDVALALLCQPDPLAPLRDRIAEVKPEVIALLARAGIATIDTDPYVPWLMLPGDDATRAALVARQLVAKDVPVADPASWPSGLLRLSVPLSAARLKAFEAAVS